MAKLTQNEFIEQLKGATGVYVEVEISSHGGQIQLPVTGIHKGGEGFSQHAFIVHRNKEVGAAAGNVRSYLEKVSNNIGDNNRCSNTRGEKPVTRRYRMDKIFVKGFLQRVNEGNERIHNFAQEFVDNYDENKAAFAKCIEDYCIANKCKGKSKKIIAHFMKLYPSKNEILSAGITYDMTVYKPSMYDLLDDDTREIVDECERTRDYINTRMNISKRCNEVLSRLGDLSTQIINNGKLHGSTIKGYQEAVQLLKVVNEVEFPAPMPEVSAFLSVANMAIDNPVQTLDSFIMGFMRFYYTQGMLDYLPYDDLDECYSREVIEDIGQDPNNGLDVLAAKLKAGQF